MPSRQRKQLLHLPHRPADPRSHNSLHLASRATEATDAPRTRLFQAPHYPGRPVDRLRREIDRLAPARKVRAPLPAHAGPAVRASMRRRANLDFTRNAAPAGRGPRPDIAVDGRERPGRHIGPVEPLTVRCVDVAQPAARFRAVPCLQRRAPAPCPSCQQVDVLPAPVERSPQPHRAARLGRHHGGHPSGPI